MTGAWRRHPSPSSAWCVVALLWLVAPHVALGQGLPMAWELGYSGQEVWAELEPAADLSAARVQFLAPGGRVLREERRATWPEGEAWRVVAPMPAQAGEVTLRVQAQLRGQARTMEAGLVVPGSAPAHIEVDVSGWDGASPAVRVRHAAQNVRYTLLVHGEDGEALITREVEPDVAAGQFFSLTWAPPRATTLYFEVRATTASGATAYTRFVPWSFEVDVEQVHFPTGSSDIPAEEERKLREGLAALVGIIERVGRWTDLQLYIGGYTDTVGQLDANRRLSQARARSLGRWLRREGLTIPVFVQGFGQEVLAVPTGPQVDEPANRRAVFVLAGHPPRLPVFPRDAWERLP